MRNGEEVKCFPFQREVTHILSKNKAWKKYSIMAGRLRFRFNYIRRKDRAKMDPVKINSYKTELGKNREISRTVQK